LRPVFCANANATGPRTSRLPPQSDLAQQVIRDPYNFDFLSLKADVKERDRELAVMGHVRDFLLDLGVGVSRQSKCAGGKKP